MNNKTLSNWQNFCSKWPPARKKYIFAPMFHKLRQIAFVLAAILIAQTGVWAQNSADSTETYSSTITNDSIIIVSDSLAISDTILATNDTIIIASEEETIVDSTYYSLYGYVFHVDDTLSVESWKYNPDQDEILTHRYDSTLDMIQLDHPAYKKVTNNDYLGHTGLAVQSNIFFDQHEKAKFIFMQPFTPYTYQTNQTKFYNVAQPFTKFSVSIGSREEQNVDVLHTQNVNPYLNIFVNFKSFTGNGQYEQQETRNGGTIFGGAYSKGPLTTHASFAFNKISVDESGGIYDIRMVTDTTMETSTLGNKIKEGKTIIKNRQFFFDQKIGFVKAKYNDTSDIGGYWFSLQYNYQWDKNLKEYYHTSDQYYNPVDELTYNVYQNNYSNAETFDSSSFIENDHLIRFNLEEIPGKYPGFGAYFGLGFNNSDNYYYNVDTLFNNSQNQYIHSSYFEAGIHRLQSRFVKFTGLYRQYTGGYRAGDFDMQGSLFQDFGQDSNKFVIRFEGGLHKKTPDYFLQSYYSNHFRWNNNFDGALNTNFKFSLDYPKYNTSIKVRYAILDNYVYFNENGLPTQHNKAFTVFDAKLQNKLKFYRFRLVTRLNYQSSSNTSVLPLPELSYYGSLYFEHLVRFHDTGGKMKLQLGADVLYWSSFYAQQYIPSLATFGNQSTQLTGNYPFIGAFVNFEIKRLRFYFRGEHLNYGYTQSNYFASPGYPTGRLGIRYGLVWTFYD